VPGKRLWRIGAGRAGGSGRTSRPFKIGPEDPVRESSPQTARLRTVFCPPTDAPFLSLLHFPVALPTGEAGRSLGSARGARGWQPAIGSPTLTPRSGLGANLGGDVGFHGFSSQSCHGLHLVQVLSFFTVICLVCRVSNTSPLSTSHPPEESTSTATRQRQTLLHNHSTIQPYLS
jgi:hypothetical protein